MCVGNPDLKMQHFHMIQDKIYDQHGLESDGLNCREGAKNSLSYLYFWSVSHCMKQVWRIICLHMKVFCIKCKVRLKSCITIYYMRSRGIRFLYWIISIHRFSNNAIVTYFVFQIYFLVNVFLSMNNDFSKGPEGSAWHRDLIYI